MQNRYSGDVGDFGKFGLLRHLMDGSTYVLGINWYLFPDEGHNDDGKFVHYLSKSNYERCDTDIHKKLKSVIKTNRRSVKKLENADLFDQETIFFSDIINFHPQCLSNTKEHKEGRLRLRNEWCDRAIKKLSNANALFLDPDNGLEIDSCKNLSKKKQANLHTLKRSENNIKTKHLRLSTIT